MKKRKFFIKEMGIIIGIICILSVTVFGISLTNINTQKTQNLERNKDKTTANKSIEINGINDFKIYTADYQDITYEQWKEGMEGNSKKLPREKVLELYNEGYDFYDIATAENLAGLCGKTPQELLELKGKNTYTTVNGNLIENSNPWENIITQLNIKMQKPTEALGFTKKQIDEMKAQGLNDNDIEQVAVLSFNYKKEYKSILNDLKKGKNIEELKKQYWENNREDSKKQDADPEVAKKNTEKVLRKKYNITDEDINKCRSYGINEIVEIAIAKYVSQENNVGIDKVLELKKSKMNWKTVKEELEANKNEK